MDAFWELVCAALPGKGCDCVLAGLKKLFGKIAAYTSRSLDVKLLENALLRLRERYSTYAHDGNFFNAVDKASWLILGIFWGHFGWGELWSGLKNVFKLIDLGLGFKCVCGYADDGWLMMKLLSYPRTRNEVDFILQMHHVFVKSRTSLFLDRFIGITSASTDCGA